jgi:hypothetical protein
MIHDGEPSKDKTVTLLYSFTEYCSRMEILNSLLVAEIQRSSGTVDYTGTVLYKLVQNSTTVFYQYL